MKSDLSPAEVEKAIRALTVAERTNLGIEVTLPVAFGDGELVTVVIERVGDAFQVHDAGLSAMRLAAVGISLSKHVAFRLNEFSRRYRCHFLDGRVTATAALDDVAQVACLVANAARAVADYAYEIRRQAEYDFRIVLIDRLKELAGPRLRDAEEIKGTSGISYRVPIILDPQQTRPQNFVSPVANRVAVSRAVSMFFDIRPLYEDVERDAVCDDDADIRKEDRTLLRSVGTKVFGLGDAPLLFTEALGHG
jgi:hypothetical protein